MGFPLGVLHKFIPAQPLERRTLQFPCFPFALNGERPADRSGKRNRGEKNKGGKMGAGRLTGKKAKGIVRYRLCVKNGTESWEPDKRRSEIA